MTNKIIFVIRHGPTDEDENIKINKFIDYAPKIATFIKNYLDNNNIDLKNSDLNTLISSSPIERAFNTGKIILSYLNLLYKTDLELMENKNLLRWDNKNETREEMKKRAFDYGKRVNKKINKSDKNVVYIFFTHSSILNSFINGIINDDKKREHLVNTSVNVIKNGKLDIQNKKIR